MKITFHGAARTVTGSRHLLEVNGKKILLDCGLVQGRRSEADARNRKFPFDPAEIDAVVLSHAHIDHSGALPALVRRGFKGTIFSTLATADLANHMLRDSGFIQEKDVEFINKRNKKRHGRNAEIIEPLYTVEDAEEALEHFSGMRYRIPFPVVPGVECTFVDAGHMLGSAIVSLRIDDRGSERSVVFSGDIGRPHMPIIRDPKHTATPDVLIMESTYGGRDHVPNDQAEDHLAAIMNKICGRRGKLIIPAFSVGRTQEIVYKLTQLRRAGKISSCPIFVDSPLAVKATDVFDRHPECYDAEIRKIMREQGDPFGMEDITYIKSVEESKALNDRKGPFTVISASGMMEGGRVLHHLRNSISNPENAILIVGYQAEHTLGRKILRGDEEVSIYGEPFPVRAEVFVMNELSAHADRGELMDWYEKNEGTPQQVFLVHGDEDQSTALAATMEAKTSAKIEVPHLDQSFTL
ncbi:MAG: MBL fold metallo-hydrolase [Candidatus Eisenbacteria bacterium]|nr:MBL fold metallo-hydrolase [Candidatus Eisenbacteria bacterium]